ncbi:MAG TPA: hypothetical protein VNN77_16135 [candidate division Zixibacteria bacterium]|nr:hypothetical protein [candidate division Zixibacteria bacterium]
MSRADATREFHFETVDYRPWVELLKQPVLIGAGAAALVLLIVVAASKPAWDLLGAGRGLVPETLYPVTGFLIVLGTTYGQVVGWAIGTGIAVYVMTLVGFPRGWATLRLAMTVVYVGLAVLPLSVFHVLYGGWLLDLPRAGLSEWLAENHPGSRWLLIYAHPVIDFSLVVLAALFLGTLWRYDKERIERDVTLLRILSLSLFGTSFAVALSLAIHSILAHARVGL